METRYHTLSDTNLAAIVEVILDVVGPGLGVDEFKEALLLAMEDVPGMELIGCEAQASMAERAYSIYCNQRQHEDSYGDED